MNESVYSKSGIGLVTQLITTIHNIGAFLDELRITVEATKLLDTFQIPVVSEMEQLYSRD